jgi:hypothetical protein
VGGGVSKLGPLGTTAIYWPIVPARGDCGDGEFGGMNWHGKPKYSEKTCPGSTSSTTNPTWPDPDSNPGRRGGKPATNRLSYGAARPTSLLASFYFVFFWTDSVFERNAEEAVGLKTNTTRFSLTEKSSHTLIRRGHNRRRVWIGDRSSDEINQAEGLTGFGEVRQNIPWL